MTDEEIQREKEEAERLTQEIHATSDRINRIRQENQDLENEIEYSIRRIRELTDNCRSVGRTLYEDMRDLSSKVSEAEIRTSHVFDALNELTKQYITFKTISKALKNVIKFTDEYHTKFSYYDELRRITLGYVVGIDSHIISSETARKKVEKAYLQNTNYWLAYCIAAVMLWASDEPEAAQRAMNKSLSLHPSNASLFYLLINLRFNRIDTAKKWYVNYLDQADMNALGDEWQYLLQAYLFGVFGSDEEFQTIVSQCFRNMLSHAEVTTVDFASKFTRNAVQFAQLYAHKSKAEYITLLRTCREYEEMHSLLSAAEKNKWIAKYYDSLAAKERTEALNLPQRIENVLYSLINDYDDEEWKLVQKIRKNEGIISAQGDTVIAQKNFHSMFSQRQKKKNFGDLLLTWAFADGSNQADVSVKRFSISLMKDAIAKGFETFVETYRLQEKDQYTFIIDGFTLECSENDLEQAEAQLDSFYDQSKLIDTFNDQYVLIYAAICAAAFLALLSMTVFFSPAILTIAVLVGISGCFLLWQRIMELRKILLEKKRRGKLLLKQALCELAQWRKDYHDADAKSADLVSSIAKF